MPQTGLRFSLADGVLRSVLSNGVTALFKESRSAPVVAILASVRIGYFNEPDKWSGIAHVIEHMLFKGTPSRPKSDAIARDVRALGGLVNAATSYDETYYYVVVPAAGFDAAVEILADAVGSPLFDAGELSKEIEVIVHEGEQKRDNPAATLIESLRALAYDRHRIRRWRIGMPEPLRALSRNDLIRFHTDTYRPDNMTLAVVGDVSQAHAVEVCERYWSAIPRGVSRIESSPSEPPHSRFRFRRMDGAIRQRLFALQVPAPPILHPDAPPLMVLGALLSDGRSSRFYSRLKEQRRLVSTSWAGYEGFSDLGQFTMGAECVDDDPAQAEVALWAEIERVRTEEAASADLQRVKRRIAMRRLFAQEEVMGVARTLAGYENLGDYALCDETMERLQAVTSDDIRRVAGRYLSIARTALLEYLPTGTVTVADASASQRERSLRASAERADASNADAATAKLSSKPMKRLAAAAPGAAARESATASPGALVQQTARAIHLPNGATLYFRRRTDLPLCAVSLLFRGGRRRERERDCGITNLMLKASMKGTTRYSAEEIANRIESLGSGIGLSHGSDYFGYSLKLERDAFAAGLDLLGDVVANPSFPPDEITKERLAIQAEIRRSHDSNAASAYDLFTSCCYGDHPYGLPGAGIADAVAALDSPDLRLWHAAHITGANAVIGMVADMSEAEAEAACTRLLEGIAARSESFALDANTGDIYRPFGERVETRDRRQTAAFFGFPGSDAHGGSRYALDLLAEVCSGLSGRLFRAVRGENALAYQVSATHRTRLDAGTFAAYAATEPSNEQRARDLILSECRRLGEDLIPEDELAAARASIIGEHAIATQTFASQATELALAAVFDLPPDQPERYLARMLTLSPEEIRATAAHHLDISAGYWVGAVRGVQPSAPVDSAVSG